MAIIKSPGVLLIIKITISIMMSGMVGAQSACDICLCQPTAQAPTITICEPRLHLTLIPANIVNTTTILIVDGGNITTVRENDLQGLTALSQLLLANNSIETVNVGAFRDLMNLKTLNLGQNQIMQAEGSLFAGLTNLTHLDISNNKISMVPDMICTQLMSLLSLTAQQNKIQGIGSNTFKGCGVIAHLDLSTNDIMTIAEDAFEGLDSLTTLDISNNKLTMFYSAWLTNKSSNINFGIDNSTWYCTTQLKMEYEKMKASHPNIIGCDAEGKFCPTCVNFGGRKLINLTMEELSTMTTVPDTTEGTTSADREPTDSTASSGDGETNTKLVETTCGARSMINGSRGILIIAAAILGFLPYLRSVS